MNRMKAAAEWFHNTVFKDESIQPRPVQQVERLPSMLLAVRSLEIRDHQSWQSRESIFLKQGKLLANYEDDYDFHGGGTHYYPTYQSLSDQELRGYFSWRTRLRRGDLRQTSLSFAFLYIYELLNQIGVDSPEDGYQKLVDFRDAYGKINISVLPYLERWMADYVIYYGLDPELLSGMPQVIHDRSVTAVERIRELDGAEAVQAVKALSSKWLARSRFYADHQADMDAVTVRVLRRMSDHCAAKCKKSLVEQYFGGFSQYHARLFDAAVFCDPLKRRDYEYTVDEQCKYRCEKGVWSVWKRSVPPGSSAKLEDLLKTIDSVMREESGYRHPVKAGVETKWVLRIIHEEIRMLAEEKKAAEEKKISIDYSQLARIRQDAAATREKLIVEEEMDQPPVLQAPAPEYEQTSIVPLAVVRENEEPPEEETPLEPAEYRLVQCLLYGGDLGWVQAEGHLLSVLVDGVNEKLYDTFQDTVLDDTPQLVED
ncbi:MAG: TerB N-terminal domain-containing protein, partial [Oscillospiraceae bacterium]|nr:TerB N-terminal domain-containing protein [Oscillospiraceae bacterium]